LNEPFNGFIKRLKYTGVEPTLAWCFINFQFDVP
jgi:hypothetical protein